jgi:hypothetical protein
MEEEDGDDHGEANLHPYLDTLRQLSDANMHLAVPAALFYCAKHKTPAPAWLTEHASLLLNGLLHLHDDRPRRMMQKSIKTYQENQKHFARYDAVKSALEARADLASEIETLAKLRGIKAIKLKKRIISEHNRIGKSDEHVFNAVSIQLEGKYAAGDEDAIKKSYQRVSREERRNKMNFKYHVFDRSFLARIGIR